MPRNIIILFLFIFSFQTLNSKPLVITGLEKLNLNDIQAITSVDIKKIDYQTYEIDKLVNELYDSDLIFDLIFNNNENNYSIEIQENKLIQNIFFINNARLKDNQLIDIINSKKNSFLTKNSISLDISIINSVYRSRGFNEVSTTAKVEKFAADKINLIYDIYEGNQSKLTSINFFGNNSFSDKYLTSQITSQALRFYNIFKSGSNLNNDVFDFDSKQILNFYKNNGFLDINLSYELISNNFGTYSLNFYIEEGIQYKINTIKYSSRIENFDFIEASKEKFLKKLSKNEYFYNKDLVGNYLEEINLSLLSNNIFTYYVDYYLDKNNDNLVLEFTEKPQEPKIINKINISGNTITKDKTIRSKIIIEPGDYYNTFLVNNSLSNLNKFSYIKNSNYEFDSTVDKPDLSLFIDEEKKTGNILAAATYNTDTDLGIMLGIEDKNIAGSGNILNSNFKINAEDLKFDINYTQFPLINPFLSNTYSIYNQENDYTSSFGYKSLRQGFGYFLKFANTSQTSYGVGVNYDFAKGHSATNTSQLSITDNIGNFENIIFNFSISKDTTDDIFNPSNGHYNQLQLNISPTGISDDPYFKFVYSNKNYFNFKKSKNFIFFNNNFGYAESLKSKLKTINAFSLGGSNFKGFDFRGIGPIENNFYLGGNQFYTSTLGYGSSFLFDEKDNINIKLFLTAGSIGNSDYVSNNDFDIRSSAGVSFDFITAVGPVSFTIAQPLLKESNDKVRIFSFTIGSSF
jgi:outer membrane protein insertion porin family